MSTIIATGRLGRDAELKDISGGKRMLTFSIADDIGFGNNKKTQWLNCVMFGDRAERLEQYLQKGKLIEIIGTPEATVYNDKASIKIVVNEVKLHGGGDSNNSRGGSRDDDRDDDRGGRGRGDNRNSSRPQQRDLDDDIPF